jgi:plasmid stability protein
MPQLLVRNIEARVVKKLRLKAARDGVSVEEEHRRILRDALMGSASKKKKASPPKMNFKEFLLTFPDIGDDSVLKRVRSHPRKSPF